MSTDIVCQVMSGGLRAVSQAEASKLEGLHGKEVMAKVSQPRNLAFHRKAFALFHAIYELVDTELTFEQFRTLLVAKAGYGDFVEGKKGLIFIPKSLSFGSMDQTTFERVYQDVLNVALHEYGVDENAIYQILEFA